MEVIDTTNDPLIVPSILKSIPKAPQSFVKNKPQIGPQSSTLKSIPDSKPSQLLIDNVQSDKSDSYDRFVLKYHRINTFEKKYTSTTAMKRDMRIPVHVRGILFNQKIKERMMNMLGVTYYICNMILYLKCHPNLRRKEFLIPIGYIYDGVKNQYYNYENFIRLKHELFIEYDKIRPITMKQQGVINEIHSMLYPHDCECRIDWYKFGLDCIGFATHPDENIQWTSKPNSMRYRFSDLKTPKQQMRIIGHLRQRFFKLNSEFVKSNESILNFINYYYSAIIH